MIRPRFTFPMSFCIVFPLVNSECSGDSAILPTQKMGVQTESKLRKWKLREWKWVRNRILSLPFSLFPNSLEFLLQSHFFSSCSLQNFSYGTLRYFFDLCSVLSHQLFGDRKFRSVVCFLIFSKPVRNAVVIVESVPIVCTIDEIHPTPLLNEKTSNRLDLQYNDTQMYSNVHLWR